MKTLDLEKTESKSFLEQLFCQVDQNKNTALHIAAMEPITDQKLTLISKMLEKGAKPSMKNENDLTFLNMSLNMSQKLYAHINNMDEDWFRNLITSEELKGFIDLKDDELFCSMLNKFSKLTNTEEAMHPIKLLHQIWNDRKVLEKSFHQLLIWEAKHHNNDLNEIKKCCYI